MYKEGLVRLCTEKYKTPSSRNLKYTCMHLTNYSINKNSNNFEADDNDFSKGSKRNFAFFNQYVESMGHNSEKIWKDVADVVVKTILCIQPQLKEQYKACMSATRNGSFCCFEILGFDIFLDEKLKPWLLEVNHSPSLNIDTALDLHVKSMMLEEVMSMLVIDPMDRIRHKKMEKARSRDRITGQSTQYHSDLEWNSTREIETKKYLEEAERYAINFQRIYPAPGCEIYEPLFTQSSRSTIHKFESLMSISRTMSSGGRREVDCGLNDISEGEYSLTEEERKSNQKSNRNHKYSTRDSSAFQELSKALFLGSTETIEKAATSKSMLYKDVPSRYMPPKIHAKDLTEQKAKHRCRAMKTELILSKNAIDLDSINSPDITYGTTIYPTNRGVIEDSMMNITKESESLLERFAHLMHKNK
jgi:hypothetical protein